MAPVEVPGSRIVSDDECEEEGLGSIMAGREVVRAISSAARGRAGAGFLADVEREGRTAAVDDERRVGRGSAGFGLSAFGPSSVARRGRGGVDEGSAGREDEGFAGDGVLFLVEAEDRLGRAGAGFGSAAFGSSSVGKAGVGFVGGGGEVRFAGDGMLFLVERLERVAVVVVVEVGGPGWGGAGFAWSVLGPFSQSALCTG
jgi:hypothetical protein